MVSSVKIAPALNPTHRPTVITGRWLKDPKGMHLDVMALLSSSKMSLPGASKAHLIKTATRKDLTFPVGMSHRKLEVVVDGQPPMIQASRLGGTVY